MIAIPNLKAMRGIGKECILGTFREVKELVVAVLCGGMERNLRENGARVRRMDGEYGNPPKEIVTRESGGTTNKMAEVATSTQGHRSSVVILRIF